MSLSAQGRPIEAKNIYRFGVFALAVLIGVTTLSGRMLLMQVVEGQKTATVSNANPTETVTSPSPRGLIFDAKGQPLVRNVTTFLVTVTPSDLPLDRKKDVAAKLASLLDTDASTVVTEIDGAAGSLYQPVTIAENVDVQVARFIEENSDALPGVKIAVVDKRQYLTGTLFAQLIGYEGRITQSQVDAIISEELKKDPANSSKQLTDAQKTALLTSLGHSNQDTVGQAGLEYQYQDKLRGTYGTQQVSLDDAGKPIPGLDGPVDGMVSGDSLTLNIDTKEQQLATDALQWGMSNAGISQGALIVENPQNGKILAMVSLPTYDDQPFADGISQTAFQKLLDDKNQPLLNKAISQYAPGSTYKLVTATAGLSGVPAIPGTPAVAGNPAVAGTPAVPPAITPESTFVSQPYITAPEAAGDPTAQRFYEWDRVGWGPLNIIEAIARSSDTFFYQLAYAVKIDNLAYWARQYGFGASTGIDLPGEAAGIVLDTAYKKKNTSDPGVFTGETYLAGIGQGYDAATPLQILNAYCALANGGNLWQPQLVQSTTDPTGKVTDVQPKLIRRLDITPTNLAVLRQGMREVVTTGHTGTLSELPLMISGKTGTAEFGVRDRNGNLPWHEWFVGWVPANPYADDFSKSDSPLAVIGFMYGANTKGNVAVEVVRYYLWKHFGLKGDVTNTHTFGGVNWWSLRRGLLYGN